MARHFGFWRPPPARQTDAPGIILAGKVLVNLGPGRGGGSQMTSFDHQFGHSGEDPRAL